MRQRGLPYRRRRPPARLRFLGGGLQHLYSRPPPRYAGTPSEHVFYDLPNLVAGDEILPTESNGTTYSYAVSEILEVSTTDLSVTAPVGRDVVSLQTCIENYGDYWTMGPNWLARYIVRAARVI